MASNQLIQASTNLKENLNQISTVHVNLNEDVVPLFKLNQLRYILSRALNEVENISKMYAQYDTPFQLFNATWASPPNVNCSNQDENSRSHSDTGDNSFDDVSLLKNVENTKSIPIITLSPPKKILDNCTQASTSLKAEVTENTLSDAGSVKPMYETTIKSCWYDFVNSRKSASEVCSLSQPIPASCNDSTNEVPNHELIEIEPSEEVHTISNKRNISAKELLAKRAKITATIALDQTSSKPAKSFTPNYNSKPRQTTRFSPKPYLNKLKHFTIVKNQSHFKAVKKTKYSHQSPFNVPKVPTVKFCKMCGYFTRIISQSRGKIYDVCRNCKFTNNYS